ncbi:MAG: hypothetical protein R3351_01305 [Nitrospirales bacterium]|nr:hypothetical protein [Nitrospirales bacterium]
MKEGKKDDLTLPTPQRFLPSKERTQGIFFVFLSISTLFALVFGPNQGGAANTSLEAVLAQSAIKEKTDKAVEICVSSGDTPISTFTLTSKECLQSGSTHSGSGTGHFAGQALAKTTYGVSAPSKLVLAVLAHAEGNVSADFDGIYAYKSYASDTFLDQITITGGPSGQAGILEVKLNVVGDITLTGNAANDSAFIEITVSSPLGSDVMKYLPPMHISDPMLFEVPYTFNTSGEFKILVEAFAGQKVSGPFSATQSVIFEQSSPGKALPLKVTLDSVSVKGIPNGDVISSMGFEYPVVSGSTASKFTYPTNRENQ